MNNRQGSVHHHPSNNPQMQPHQGNAILPKDAKIISLLLKNHGIDECEPKVVQMLIEFAYRHTVDILQESLIYAEHAKRPDLEPTIEDVRLATQRIVNSSFVTAPSRDVIAKVAAEKNCIPLPLLENEDPIKLPPEEYCLLAPHYKVTSLKSKK